MRAKDSLARYIGPNGVVSRYRSIHAKAAPAEGLDCREDATSGRAISPPGNGVVDGGERLALRLVGYAIVKSHRLLNLN